MSPARHTLKRSPDLSHGRDSIADRLEAELARPTETDLASAYRDIEGAVLDTRNASLVFLELFETMMGRPTKDPGGHYCTHQLTIDQNAALTYAAYHLGNVARALHRAYYGPEGT